MRRAGCAGACRAPAPLCLGAGRVVPGAGTRCQSLERAGGLPGGLCSLPAPGKAQPQGTRRDTHCPVLPLRALPAPALPHSGSTGGAAPGFWNLIRAVPGAGAALGSPAGAGAAEQVWAQLLHGSGQSPVPWVVSAGAGKGPCKPPEKPLVLQKELPERGMCWRQERGSC